MKHKKLLIILTIATLSLTACGKDSESAEVPTETVIEETVSDETSVEEIPEPESGEVVDNTEITEEESKLINEPLNIDDRLLEGFNEMLANGEITQEEYDKLVDSMDEAVKDIPNNSKEEQSEAEMFKEWLDNGEITQDEYEQLISGEADKGYDEIIIGGGDSEPEHVPAPLPEGATYADPSQDENIDFNATEMPDHLKGKYL